MNTNSESQTYQAMLEEVEKILKEVTAPDLDLDHLVGKVERGFALIKMMRERLESTKEKVETLRAQYEQKPSP